MYVFALARSTYYYQPVTESELKLTPMALINKEYTERSAYGRRQMTTYLWQAGVISQSQTRQASNAERGLEAIYLRPRTKTVNQAHRVYPYLLRGLEITRPNQV